MPPTTPPLTLVQEAEQARQVANVLGRVERRFTDGRWERGFRFSPKGGNCLIGAIDEATSSVIPGVAEQATRALAQRLPAPLRALGKIRPRLALAMWNDTVADRDDAIRLVREARYALGGLPLVRPTVTSPGAWVAERPAPQPFVIDLTDPVEQRVERPVH